MEFGICPVSNLPVRSDPDHQAGMVNELLFGEMVEIREVQDHWCHIAGEWDGYPGWISRWDLMEITPAFYREARRMHLVICDPADAYEDARPDHPYRLLPGSTLPFYRPDNQSFSIGVKTLKLSGTSVVKEPRGRGEDLVRHALKFVNAPYRWGGRSLFGIDCSGLIQVILKISGIRFPRDSREQVGAGDPLHFLEEAESGDLVYFGNENEDITHAGIYHGPGQVIHAFGKVRIDKLDHHGIYNPSINRYTHHLRTIIRIPDLCRENVK
jgi:cell wall-associated NlpC family hydrolase